MEEVRKIERYGNNHAYWYISQKHHTLHRLVFLKNYRVHNLKIIEDQ